MPLAHSVDLTSVNLTSVNQQNIPYTEFRAVRRCLLPLLLLSPQEAAVVRSLTRFFPGVNPIPDVVRRINQQRSGPGNGSVSVVLIDGAAVLRRRVNDFAAVPFVFTALPNQVV